MFDAVELGGTPDAGIVLQTRYGRDIPNSQAVGPDAQALRILAAIAQKHSGWISRKDPCGTYNCAGLVWASRRTAIYDDGSCYADIIADDGYTMIATDQLTVGDLALYRLVQTRRAIHVGMVVELKTIGNSRIPWVLSKWNDFSGESLHHVEDVSFVEQFERTEYDIEFWTDTRSIAQ